jgi:hypothetical protein
MVRTTTFRNWNHSAVSTPRVVAVPKNLEELIDVVKDHVELSVSAPRRGSCTR